MIFHKVRIQIFQNPILPCHSFHSSGSRNIWLLGTFSESVPGYLPKLKFKYFEPSFPENMKALGLKIKKKFCHRENYIIY
jgi:hypothetical protein